MIKLDGKSYYLFNTLMFDYTVPRYVGRSDSFLSFASRLRDILIPMLEETPLIDTPFFKGHLDRADYTQGTYYSNTAKQLASSLSDENKAIKYLIIRYLGLGSNMTGFNRNRIPFFIKDARVTISLSRIRKLFYFYEGVFYSENNEVIGAILITPDKARYLDNLIKTIASFRAMQGSQFQNEPHISKIISDSMLQSIVINSGDFYLNKLNKLILPNMFTFVVDKEKLFKSKTKYPALRKALQEAGLLTNPVENLEEVLLTPDLKLPQVPEGTSFLKKQELYQEEIQEEFFSFTDSDTNQTFLHYDTKRRLLQNKKGFLFPTERVLSGGFPS